MASAMTTDGLRLLWINLEDPDDVALRYAWASLEWRLEDGETLTPAGFRESVAAALDVLTNKHGFQARSLGGRSRVIATQECGWIPVVLDRPSLSEAVGR